MLVLLHAVERLEKGESVNSVVEVGVGEKHKMTND